MPIPTKRRPIRSTGQGPGQSRDQATHDEDDGCDEQNGATPEAISESACGRRTRGRAGERDAGDHAFHPGRKLERVAQKQQRAGNDPRVIAEQKAAERRDPSHQSDVHQEIPSTTLSLG